MPNLVVDRVGTVAFPLQEAQIDALIGTAERAPYGKGPDTVLDTSVRNSWQIDHEAFQLGGPGWPPTLQKILGEVAKGLGCDRERLEALPYKLLVYEPGGFFQPHRDTEKHVGMIGTLVVSLPTEGSGGELVVTHKGREQVIDLCVADAGTVAFAAFYADCTHETRPVRKGHRVSLVFNLVLRGPKSADEAQAPDFRSKVAELGSLLEEWVREPKGAAKIAWLLEHDYSQANLSFETLKGIDAVVARTLAAAAERARCTTHAAIVKITETGYADLTWGYDHLDELEMYEVTEHSCALTDWVAPDDSRPQYGTLSLRDREMMPNGALDGAEPDHKWVEEASGNSGINVEYSYRKASLVVWPTEKTVQTLAASDIGGAIEYVASEAARVPEAGSGLVRIKDLVAQLLDIWDASTKKWWVSIGGSEGLPKLLAVLNRIGAADLTARYLRNNAVSAYHGQGNDELAAALAMSGIDAAPEFLPELVREKFGYHPQAVLNLLWDLTENHWQAGSAAWRRALEAAGTAAIEELRKLVAPTASKNTPSWIVSTRREQSESVSEEVIGDLLSLAGRFGLRSKAAETVTLLAKHQSMASPGKSVPKALARMRERDTGASGTADYRALWALAADHLLKCAPRKPEPPRDWFIEARLDCSCKACRQLARFCSDRFSKVTKIAVARPLRSHLRNTIYNLELEIDYETERIGRPYSLVCTKHRTRYNQRRDRYASNLKQMKELIGVAPDFRRMERPPVQLAKLRAITESSN